MNDPKILDFFCDYEDVYCLGDTTLDEDEVLKRYDSAIRGLAYFGVKPLLSELAADEHSLENSIIDFSMNYGQEGGAYIEEIQTAMQYVVLQAALILTISLPQYLEPAVDESTSDNTLARAYSFMVGFSAQAHIATIILCTIFSGIINMAYNGIDALVIRVRRNDLLILIMILNYLADIAVICAMLIAGFARNDTDGYLQLWAVLIVVGLFYSFSSLSKLGASTQTKRAFMFYKKYCSPSGLLRNEVLGRIYPKTKDENPIVSK